MISKQTKGLAQACIALAIFSVGATAWAHDPKPSPGPKPATATALTIPKDVDAILRDYRAAMAARSTDKLGAVMDPEVVVVEGTHKNVGWPDYRENHIGPEMKEWKEFEVVTASVTDAVVAKDITYVATEATYRIVMGSKTITLDAAETFVLRKTAAGWRIRHVHFSGKARRPEAPKASAAPPAPTTAPGHSH